ncbi:MAG TPA: chlorophyll synthase ChlG [Chloroflexia bacterium]|nr:chlorophyll synthase ChlG [Chloroflexia bacterium]
MKITKYKPDYLSAVLPGESVSRSIPSDHAADYPDAPLYPEARRSNTALKLAVVPPPAPVSTKKEEGWRSRLPLWLSLMKPITWVPVVWSFWCGAAGTGGLVVTPEALLKFLGGLLLSGPLLCGMSQAINDYFDREVDAVNEPWRILPSGRITLRQVYQLIAALGFAGLLVAYWLGPVVTGLAFLGIFMAHNYSAPPVRLKRFTWLGPFSSAISYILLPWLAAASVFGEINWRSLTIAGLYALGGTGIMILNDFKSIRGDYQLKLPSVPVVYGTRRAAQLACLLMDGAQLAVVVALLLEDRPVAAALIGLLLLPQLVLQRYFIQKPLARAIWYNARGQNFLVLGMLLASWLAM